MSEATELLEFSIHEDHRLCPIYTLTHSIKILLRNIKLFISIFILTIFPFSFLIFSLSLYSNPLNAQIDHLLEIARFSPTQFEARQIWKQIRVDSAILLWLKLLFWIPCYGLSLFAMITSVNSTALACAGKQPNFRTAVLAVRSTWKRTSVTWIYVFVILVIYVQFTGRITVTACLGWDPRAWGLMAVLGAVLEVEMMAVLSSAMVVSVLEERFGWEALKVAWGLMEGKRFSGWVLAGFLLMVSGGVGWAFRASMYGQDKATSMGLVNKLGLICLFGLIVLCSYVVHTVLYCECKTTRHANRMDNASLKV